MKLLSIFSKNNPLQHYLYHFVIANIALFITYITFGTITIWEVLLFLFMTFSPLIDELTSASVHYLDDMISRYLVNVFLAGKVTESLHALHHERRRLANLILHNLPMYFLLCAFLYILVIFDTSVIFYAMAGIIVHLTLDIINDQYEFGTIKKWFWPIANYL
jgi:hypothetical protein